MYLIITMYCVLSYHSFCRSDGDDVAGGWRLMMDIKRDELAVLLDQHGGFEWQTDERITRVHNELHSIASHTSRQTRRETNELLRRWAPRHPVYHWCMVHPCYRSSIFHVMCTNP